MIHLWGVDLIMIMRMNWVGQVASYVQKILLGQHSSFTNEPEASVKQVLCVVPLDS
jgi:hypothetical protein